MHKRHYIITCLKHAWLLIVYCSSFQVAVAQTSMLVSLRDSLPRAKDSVAHVAILNDLSYYHYLSDIDSCFWYAVKAREIATRLQNKKGLARACNNLGIFYGKKRNAKLAIIYDYEALQLYRAIGDSEGVCTMMGNLAVDYEADSNFVMEQYYQQLALQMGDKLPGYADYSVYLANYLMDYWRDSTKQDSVQWAYNKLRALTANEPYTWAWFQARLFEALEMMKEGRGKEAEKRLNEWADTALKKGVPDIAISAYTYVIEDLIPKGYKADSIGYAEKIVALAGKNGDDENMMYYVNILFPHYMANRNIAKVAAYGNAIRKLANAQQEQMHNNPKVDYIGYFLKEQQMQELHFSSQVQQQAIAKSDLQKAGRHLVLIFLTALLILFIFSTIIYCWSYYASHRYEHRLAAVNAQITEKNMLLQSNDDFKNKLLSVIAHDFRAPLSDIIKVAGLLNERSPDRAAMLATIGRAAVSSRRTLDIFDGILRWMKAQLSGFSYVPVRCNIKMMLKEALDGIQQEAAGKQLQTNLEMPDGIMVAADPEMLQFMHHHLLQHMVAFASPGGSVIVKAQQETGRIKVIIKAWPVTVIPGMLHLFEHSRHNEGLALIICRDFMDKMGGSIWTASDGAGTFSFIYSLPSFH